MQYIYEALDNDPKINFTMTREKLHEGDLTSWADQGVFLLDAILTIKQHKSLSHSKHGWENFTKETINVINKNCSNVVYMLWGFRA